MDILVWILTGGIVGWIGFSRFGLNEGRGRSVSIILGAVGAVIGAKAIAPLLITMPTGGELSALGVLFAAAAAAAMLALGNLISERWGV